MKYPLLICLPTTLFSQIYKAQKNELPGVNELLLSQKQKKTKNNSKIKYEVISVCNYSIENATSFSHCLL